MSAVKPKERTDQYLILAAMLALSAHKTPIPAREITSLLKLHLRAKAPKNVRASLRAYKAYASPADPGPPLRWSLTEAGLQRLRTASGLPLPTTVASDSFKSDIGIICALEYPELEAVTRALGGQPAWTEVGDARLIHVYRRTTIDTSDSTKLHVVATTATSMGLTAAAIAATQLILQFCPKLIAMIGIAAGTRSGGKQIGDILVADPSVDYNSGKVALENGIREFQPDPYPIGLNPRVRSVLQKYATEHPLLAEVRSRWPGPTPTTHNRLHLGPLGAADQVINDESRVLEVQKNWRKLIGVEMETYGVYRAAHEAPEPKPRVVSFKAVCDFAAHKTDSWQEYAAFMAAEFAKEFFKREWKALWPRP